MSASYASRLSHYPNKGVVGLPENFDTSRAFTVKIKQLTNLIQTSNYVVILTGAGISTAAKIPDFRGPSGIWTLEKQREEKLKKESKKRKRQEATNPENGVSALLPACDFGKAEPTLTHRAITMLCQQYHKVQYVITQNVDGLHRRSGLSRDFHSTVHGCVFTEKCARCGVEIFCEQETGGLSFQPTGRKCPSCKIGAMHDILLDWEDVVLDLEKCNKECKKADLVICLGTSLRINPVGSLPLLAKQFVIVNLQLTPFDEQAALVIRAKVDEVMAELMVQLGYRGWHDVKEPFKIERQWKPPDGDNSEFAEILADKRQHEN
jgi:mono-ADP-ribosyltransferase sirtuin 6